MNEQDIAKYVKSRFRPKYNIAEVLLICVLSIYLTFFTVDVIYRIDQLISKKHSLINEEVILNSDTLLITDYNIFTDGYTLSDGSVIDYKLAERLYIIKIYNHYDGK